MKLRSLEFPAEVPILQTQRLRLTPITDADAEDYFAICSNPEVMRPWGTRFHTEVQETRDLIAYLERQLQERRMIRWGVRESGSSKLIGDVGFWRFVDPRLRAEIGTKLTPAFWNRGYMTEAMAAAIDYAFRSMNVNSIEANLDPGNLNSIRMVEKLGFEREGHIREHSYCAYRERFVDTYLYSLRWKPNPS